MPKIRQRVSFGFPGAPDRSANSAPVNKAKKAKGKAASGLADNVKQLSVQESVKPKSKQLNVVEEHRKANRKKAANFVVIGKMITKSRVETAH